MATTIASAKPAGKRKLTWKECCNKWGQAAMEQQKASQPTKHMELKRDHLAAYIFAFVPDTEWHKYYYGNRGGPSVMLAQLHDAIHYGEKFSWEYDFTTCPDCGDVIEAHKCEECSRRFIKSDENLHNSMNAIARQLGGYDAFYASTWSEFERARYEIDEAAPTAGMLLKRAKDAEKILGKRPSRREIREVELLWEEYEEAKVREEAEETSDVSYENPVSETVALSTKSIEAFPPLNGKNPIPEVVVVESAAEESRVVTKPPLLVVASSVAEVPKATVMATVGTTKFDVVTNDNQTIQFGQITESVLKECRTEKVSPPLVVEPKEPVSTVSPAETGFFFGTIPAVIPLPVKPILEATPVMEAPAAQQVITKKNATTVIDQTQPQPIKVAADKATTVRAPLGPVLQKRAKLPRTLDPWTPKPKTAGEVHHKMVCKWVEKIQKVESEKQAAVWKKLDEQLAARNEAKKDLKVKWRWGLYRLVKKTRKDNQRQRQKKRMEKEQQLLQAMPPQILTGISLAGGPAASLIETPMESGRISSTPSMKRKKILKSPVLSQDKLRNLVQATLKIAYKKRMAIEIIGKKCTKGQYGRFQGASHLFLRLKHMEGWRRPVDLNIHKGNMQLIMQAAHIGSWNKSHHSAQLGKGSSGLVLNPDKLVGPRGHAPKGLFVVRGALKGVVYDARMRLGRSVLPYIEQFSTTMERFTKGFDERFKQLRQTDNDHVCESTYDAEQAGSVAAIVHHMILPMNRTTCKYCSNKIDDMSRDEWCDYVRNFVNKNKILSQFDFKDFKHLPQVMDFIADSLVQTNKNVRAFNEIQTLIGDRVDAPFTTVCEVNKVLVKGGRAKVDEFTKASENLLEIARYLKNRTESIKKGSLKSFRNKISQKAAVNLALMCDNQLDKNGNLIWGERGYHSKRFFANYFDIINPEEGYEKYVLRSNPNGVRKLAIGKLIVSTNFSVFREQMKGEPIHKQHLDNHCTSKLDGNFVYPCCCVTHDDGQPVESEFKLPTKNHLVIGNSGDPKYVDMPPEISKKMYIAKDGYCYVNIFLAMLVNVNEAEAKDFTKQVRDVLMEKLGKWPSMFDVATACAFMSVFYPETRNAELPRILIDHTTKTMHVVDSFGSLSTGYHILKANTVSQLIKFASSSLDSEMKHYLVGGTTALSSREEHCMRTLIKGVYKPKIMHELLSEDPYILLMSVLSPRVLIALFNSGSLEIAMDTWVSKDQTVATIIGTVSELAQKVSVSRVLEQQLRIIETQSHTLLFDSAITRSKTPIFDLSQRIIRGLSERRESNRVLYEQGHSVVAFATSFDLMEKIWDKLLRQEFAELSWLEKCLQTMRLCSFSHVLQSTRMWRSTEGLRDKASDSFTTLRTKSVTLSIACKKNVLHRFADAHAKCVRTIVQTALSAIRFAIPDVLKFVNMLLVVNLLLQIAKVAREMVQKHHKAQLDLNAYLFDQEIDKVNVIYDAYCMKIGGEPTMNDFLKHIEYINPTLLGTAKWLCYTADVEVEHQGKSKKEMQYEKIIAFISLLLMVVDSERSDCVYKALQKLKGLMSSIGDGVYHQSLDDITNVLEEKNLTVDFELQGDECLNNPSTDATFNEWWKRQIESNNTLTHYRTEGLFMEFTRSNAIATANNIANLTVNDILVRGAVGSGKSTGLPFYLSRKGRVLLLEPTRPLAENVHRQLGGEPFMVQTTLRMRGLTVFGSHPISVMTTGFAFHYYANNPEQLREYDFIIIDECHVNDAQAMAFRCLLKEHEFQGKIIKTSATPPGREVEFSTQYPVQIKVEERLSFKSFVEAQGTGSNADVTSTADNILVYVASYNEVDELSRLLIDAGHKVTKVDGRTMKVGSVEIRTSGTTQKKHFVVATNIIENGVTLDIEAVVDFGTKVTAYLDVDLRMIITSKGPISYGERIQRLGRVGRHKAGVALRIGFTEKGLVDIPQTVATEAAFLCFAHGLPVMTPNVSTSLLGSCTVKQARTMLQFELTPFYMVHMVRFDGTMHPAIHNVLKKYKLRDAETALNKLAIPNRGITGWMTASDYNKAGQRLDIEDTIRIPFLNRTMPEKIHIDVWDAILRHKHEAGFGRVSCINSCKIAYTLQTDVYAIPRTVKIIDALISDELRKKEHYKTITGRTVSSNSFTLNSIATLWRTRYAQDYTSENIAILSAVKAQLMEFENLAMDATYNEMSKGALEAYVRESGATSCVLHQTKEDLSKFLKLKGIWNKSIITQDLLVLAGVFVGGIWMIISGTKESFDQIVTHQGKEKRQRQKLKFRQARDNKLGFEVHADDGTIEHFFGSAYTKKGKQKGKTCGMGAKNRKFINMYGFDPTEYSFVRFVDPLTGIVIDDSPYTDIMLVQEKIGEERHKAILDDKLTRERVAYNPSIQAYYVNEITNAALKVDLTPHNPLLACERHSTIAGHPEHEGELRQTGAAQKIDIREVPRNPDDSATVSHESKSLFRGLRDYNPIASVICHLINEADGRTSDSFGIGYGGLIVTNRHLFKRNNGTLTIRSRHGEFVIKNTTQLGMNPCIDRDILVIKMPKDIPPFPQKIKFRVPKENERICLIGSNFQDKSITSTISETSVTCHVPNSHFWKHWIDTKDGHCGLPLVSTTDGAILGVHSLSNLTNTQNFFASVPENFERDYLQTPDAIEWIKKWSYNPNEICWGTLELKTGQPTTPFKVTKLITDLDSMQVYAQARSEKWVLDRLYGNLKAVGQCPAQLVTKHVVKGKCMLFDLYLQQDQSEKEFFTPLMSAYGKSRLNKEAYNKDLFKYATPIRAGDVCTETFEKAESTVITMLKRKGFDTCNYVTDPEEILKALNMKAAVGAMYSGKKKDYFDGMTESEIENLLFHSCKRLFMGQRGLWNGSLKAELRPIEKVEANKTRTFTAAPLDTLLGGKVCVDDFNNMFYNHHLKCPWTVGITKFYQGWDRLLTSLPNNWLYCDADGSQFDSSLSPYLINSVLNIRRKFMEDWDVGDQMLRNLYTEIVYTPILTPDGTIVKKFKGNNSGQPSTVVDNTLMVVLAMHYTLLKLGIQESEFEERCVYFANGDDLLIAMRPDTAHLLDNFGECFAELGLNYDFSSRTSKKEELWFMSHCGIMRDGMFIPKLEPERIVSILEWDRSHEPIHRLEAICAAMVEAWGYDELLHHIRKFYAWVLGQAPYSELARTGKAPYIAETALRALYTGIQPDVSDLAEYARVLNEMYDDSVLQENDLVVYHQSGEKPEFKDAGANPPAPQPKGAFQPPTITEVTEPEDPKQAALRAARAKQPTTVPDSYGRNTNKDSVAPSSSEGVRDKDVNVGTVGTFVVPRVKINANKKRQPMVNGRAILNFQHLAIYEPEQFNVSNTRSTQEQFQAWYEGVKGDYNVDDAGMSILMNGLMVWCIENGTSPNINGVWTMMDGEEQITYPIKPLLDHAVPTFRQIMTHFSDVAEAYIEMRNRTKAYMPRYGLQRNLTDLSLARYAFDFYELNSTTPARAKEAHMQMKAAALKNAQNRLFGLDGNISTQEEDTERHTTTDVTRNIHNLLGMRGVQ
ncbi:polyprotein [Sweet potato virus E]|nr:polyprotein [Sweet potato virus E]